MLTQAKLKELLSYDPETGVWLWRVNKAARVKVGDPAGGIDDHGYLKLFINGRKYRAHRLAFVYILGRWPTGMVDHKDMDRSNNRWANLREATRSQNLFNAPHKKNNKCGFKGVHQRRKGGFLASIQKDGKKIHIGIFTTPEEAHAAYRAKAAELHGEFARSA